jgi:adenine-specific DNA-methyltransferase
LKNFKEKARKPFRLVPLHTHSEPPTLGSHTHHSDVLSPTLLSEIECDVVYLDPPYNERQYSKNYFPLNIIAKTPTELLKEPALKGKTGIPTDCFISPFCKKGKVVEEAFEKLFKNLKTDWIFLSYNSESLVSKSRMIELMEKCGVVTVLERDYKRFKSFEYNDDKDIKEYLFCLKVRQNRLIKAE